MRLAVALGAALVALAAPNAWADPAVGTAAPPVEPQAWLNSKGNVVYWFGRDHSPPTEPQAWINITGPVSWKALAGRVIFIEKWATW